jgi:hypothetical protein
MSRATCDQPMKSLLVKSKKHLFNILAHLAKGRPGELLPSFGIRRPSVVNLHFKIISSEITKPN